MTQYIEEHVEEKFKFTHLAGIVPIAGKPLGFGMPWHDVLFPIDSDLNLAENAVINCAWMGCDTIWIIVNDDVSPLLRKRIGDSIKDPVGWSVMGQGFSWKWFRPRRREIPIYYVRTNPVDYEKRDSISYSVLHGARVASKICKTLSRWVVPERYFISWPYSVYDGQKLSQEYRKKIKSTKKNYLFVSDDGLTIKDDFVPAILSSDILNKARQTVYNNSTGERMFVEEAGEQKWWQIKDKNGNFKFPKIAKKLKASEKYSARWHKPKDVFGFIDEEELKIDSLNMHQLFIIKGWDCFRAYILSGFILPEDAYNLISYNENSPVGYSSEELEDMLDE
jgi:hypothetical protein